ncbi:hypothetical protein PM082_017869 [Marasmius tenuissimus]|nr:hypothetical protein PM082_017869 [Marasmius tenuissimus]
MFKRVLSYRLSTANTSTQSLRLYSLKHTSRSVSVSFTPEHRTSNRKYKSLYHANGSGTVANPWGDPDGDSFRVDFVDVDAAQRFKNTIEPLSAAKVQYYKNTRGDRTPFPSVVSRIWSGLSRNLRLIPETAGVLTAEEVQRVFEREGLAVAKVSGNKDCIDIEFYVLRDALTALNAFGDRIKMPGALFTMPFLDYNNRGNPKAEMENRSCRRTILVSDFAFHKFSKIVLGSATKDHPLERATYDTATHSLKLKFLSERDMESFYQINVVSPQNTYSRILVPNKTSKHSGLDKKLPYHKELAIKLGAYRGIYLESLPRSVVEAGLQGPEGEFDPKAIAKKIEHDLSPYGIILNLTFKLDNLNFTSNRSNAIAYVNFVDIESAVAAYGKLHLAIRRGIGPLSEYRALNKHEFAAPPPSKREMTI